MKFKAFASVIVSFLIITFLFTSAYGEVPTPPESGMIYIVIDASTGDVLFEHNSAQKIYPASITKVMTSMIALDHETDMDRIMTASADAVYGIGPDGTNIGIQIGEELRFEDLLNVILIRSANEAANIVAENIAGTESAFIRMMNEKAVSLGAVNTHFANACGKHDADHYSTAYDLALIAREALKYDKIGEITQKTYYDMPTTNMHGEAGWALVTTTNKLLSRNSASKPYTVTGLKTGYTDPAGCCLVSVAHNSEGMEIISVVLKGSTAEITANYSENLLEYVFEKYFFRKLFEANTICGYADIANSTVTQIPAVYAEDYSILLDAPFDSALFTSKLTLNEFISAPVTFGDVIGSVTASYNGTEIATIPILAGASADILPLPTETPIPDNTSKHSSELKDSIILVIVFVLILLIAFVGLVVYMKIVTRRRLEARRKRQ